MLEGEQYDQYKILRRPDGSLWELGRGAMGVTYKAQDTDLQTLVALKVIHLGILGNPQTLERFQREARAAAKLRHPNIAAVYRLGRATDGTDYYTMEYCEGPTLQQEVEERGPMPVEKALRVTQQVARALQVAEEPKLIHRDIKPANLILSQRADEGMVVKVIDFGLAKSFAEANNSWVSQGGGFAGTAIFASPEQLEERDLDQRSDFYSLGVTLWYMLLAKPPFEGTLAKVINTKLENEPPWDQLAAFPSCVMRLIKRMMARSPEGRPASAQALRNEIELCQREVETEGLGTIVAKATPGAKLQHHATLEPGATAPFEQRFSLSQPIWKDSLGTVYRGMDIQKLDARMAIRVFDPSLTGVPYVRRELESGLQKTKRSPHPAIQLPLDWGWTENGLAVAFPWTDGLSLHEVLSARGTLTPAEVLSLLPVLAEACDFASANKLTGIDFSAEQLLIEVPAGLSAQVRQDLLQKPVTQWQGFRVIVGSLTGGLFSQTGQTSLFSAAPVTMQQVSGPSGPQGTLVRRLATAVGEWMGFRMDVNGGFTPVPALGQEGNHLMEQAIHPVSSANFSRAADFAQALQRAVTGPPRQAALPPPPPLESTKKATPLPMRRPAAAASSSKKPILVGLGIVLAVGAGGAGYYYGVHLPEQEKEFKRKELVAQYMKDRESRDREAKEEPVPTPQPPVETLPKQEEPKKDTGPEKPAPNVADVPTTKPTDPPPSDPPMEEDKPEVPPPPPPPTKEELAAKREAEIRKNLPGFISDQQWRLALETLAEAAKEYPDHTTGWKALANELGEAGLQMLNQRQAKFEPEAFPLMEYWAGQGASAMSECWGLILAKGLGVQKDPAKSFAALNAAASAGRKSAEYYVAECLINGTGTAADVPQGIKMLEVILAREPSNILAAGQLGVTLSRSKAPADQAKALTLLTQAANAGEPNAMFNLGAILTANCKVNGKIVEAKLVEATSWIKKAAEMGDLGAMNAYALCLERGQGVKKDQKAATEWRKRLQERSRPTNADPPKEGGL